MPLATVSDVPERKDLKTCPDGYVLIRRMSHGEKLYRSGFASKMKFDAGGSRKKGMQGEIDLMQERTSLWEFANLIVEHNLTYQQNPQDVTSPELPLDFKKAEHVKMLDARIAEEISTYIDELNNFEIDAESSEEGTLGNS